MTGEYHLKGLLQEAFKMVGPLKKSYVQSHYDAHAKSTTRRERAQGPLFELKKFHNAQKRDLIIKYGSGGSLLDLGCGRGGDIGKWMDAGIPYVTGLDISGEELDEARRRFGRFGRVRGGNKCEFQQVDLRTSAWLSPHKYDAITSMFSLHYFFDAESSLRNVLETVTRNIKPGGYFFGTVPDGKRVAELLTSGTYKNDHLSLQPMFDPSNRNVFGKAYVFALDDTVTSDARGTAGSLEYIVNMNFLKIVAAEYGLEFVESKPFEPPTEFAGATASRLFTTFVFRADLKGQDVAR